MPDVLARSLKPTAPRSGSVLSRSCWSSICGVLPASVLADAHEPNPVAKGIGVGYLVLPVIGAWALVRELLFGARTDEMAQDLEAEGGLPEDNLPRTPAGRISARPRTWIREVPGRGRSRPGGLALLVPAQLRLRRRRRPQARPRVDAGRDRPQPRLSQCSAGPAAGRPERLAGEPGRRGGHQLERSAPAQAWKTIPTTIAATACHRYTGRPRRPGAARWSQHGRCRGSGSSRRRPRAAAAATAAARPAAGRRQHRGRGTRGMQQIQAGAGVRRGAASHHHEPRCSTQLMFTWYTRSKSARCAESVAATSA